MQRRLSMRAPPLSGPVDIEPAFDLPMPVSDSLVSALMPPFPRAFGRRRLEEMPLLLQWFWPSPDSGSLLRWHGKGNMHLRLVGGNAHRAPQGPGVLSICPIVR
jgi:hypothetical protein